MFACVPSLSWSWHVSSSGNGEQLIAEEWIDYAMGYIDPIEPVDGLQYNYHWDHTGDIWAGRGMFGQTCGQVPSLDMVFAITAADADLPERGHRSDEGRGGSGG